MDQKKLIITLSENNENDEIENVEALMAFILNELENANIGAYLHVEGQSMKTIEMLDIEAEYRMRLELREVLRKTVALLTNPEAEARDADELLILIEQTLEDTAP